MDSTAGNGSEDAERMRQEIADDEIVEILARLPVKSLMQFKCVSKLWYSQILSPNFIAMHSKNNHRKTEVSLVCMLTIGGRLSFLFGDVPKKLPNCDCSRNAQILSCFNGVVCLSHPGWFVLWNPATRQFRKIGSIMDGRDRAVYPKIGWYVSGFCFDSVTNAFKVGLVKVTGTKEGQARAQVNMFSTVTNSWTEEKSIALPYRITRGGYIHGATCVNRCMLWLVANFHRDFNLDEMYILSYDMIDEVFKRIEMPVRPVRCHVHLSCYKGSLSIFVHRQTGSDFFYSEIDVWVMNDWGGANQSWSKLWTCRPSIKVRSAEGFFIKDNVDLVLMCEYPIGSVYSYDPETGETNKFGEIETSFMRTFMYRESLASLY